MKISKLIAAAAVSSMALAFVACNKQEAVESQIVPEIENQISETASEIQGEIESGFVDGEEYIDDQAFIGTWVCGRASIEIKPDNNGYAVHIIWGNSAFETSEWEYFCLFNGEELVNHGDGVYKIVTFNEDGEPTEDVQYEDGAVSFKFNETGDKILWNDEKEDAGKDMEFERTEIIEFDEEEAE